MSTEKRDESETEVPEPSGARKRKRFPHPLLGVVAVIVGYYSLDLIYNALEPSLGAVLSGVLAAIAAFALAMALYYGGMYLAKRAPRGSPD